MPEKDLFKPKLEVSGVERRKEARLFQFEGDPSRVVRHLTLDEMVRTHKDLRPYLPGDELEGVKKAEVKSKKLLAELSAHDIRFPRTEVSIGDREGRLGVYIVTDKVTGDRLREVKDPAAPKEFLRHYLGLLSYLKHNYLTGEEYLADIFSDTQYRYGETDEDPEKYIYLVDTDTRDVVRGDNKRTLFAHLGALIWNIETTESRLGIGLGEAKKKIKEFVVGLPPESDLLAAGSLVLLKKKVQRF